MLVRCLSAVGSAVVFRSVPFVVRLVLARVGLLLASGDRRDAEILALRHQVLVLQRQVPRPTFDGTDRTVLGVLSQVFGRDRLGQVFLVVQPVAVLGWRRRLVARRWTQPARRKPGRPPTAREIRLLVLRLNTENPTWGYRRIHGELHRLGHKIAASTGWKILRDAGREPTPARSGPSWSEFIRTPKFHETRDILGRTNHSNICARRCSLPEGTMRAMFVVMLHVLLKQRP